MANPAPITTPPKRSVIPALGGPILSILDQSFLGIGPLVQKIADQVDRSRQLLSDLEKFDFNPQFRTRVISVPKAIEGVNNLWNEIRHVLLNKFNEVVDTIQSLHDLISNPLVSGGLPNPQSGFQKALQTVGFVRDFLNLFADAIVKIVDLADVVDDIKKRIETLDDLFLQQQNSQIRVDTPHRQRIGKLHGS